jgi:hypothetical protein
MSVVAEPPGSDELEALIPEARARQRRRWIRVATFVALLAGVALVAHSIATEGTPAVSGAHGRSAGTKPGEACGVRGLGVRILDKSGRAVYREPGHYVHPNYGFPTIRCSGSTVWAVWFNGAGMSQEAYVGARSGDGGHTWHLVFSEPFFGVRAPHELDAYLGVWKLAGAHAAYFTGSCPACGIGTVSLWVTKDGGKSFGSYKIPALAGFAPTRLSVSGHDVTTRARRTARKVDHPPFEIYTHKTVTVHVA